MYTQCTNCQAIFSVNMREVTVSEGFLRCGECEEIFDSSESLSTTMQAPFVKVDIDDKAKLEKFSDNYKNDITTHDDWQNRQTAIPSQNQVNLRQSPTEEPKVKRTAEPLTTRGVEQSGFSIFISKLKALCSKTSFIIACLLGIALIAQITFNYRHLFLDTLKYEPEKIQMLNHNVFAHPIEKDVLLISASIKNTADFDQAFPILEVRLTNSKTELIALRRFSPEEYLDNYSAKTLLTKNRATSIKLKIKDPGNEATRFQFNFL